MHSPCPATWDLFAEATSALCMEFCSREQPFHPEIFSQQQSHCFFYQPPYSLLNGTWPQCLQHIEAVKGLWGLVPKSFYDSCIQPSLTNHDLHSCHIQLYVKYDHPLIPNHRGPPFYSILFFISKSLCQCSYLNSCFRICCSI